MLKLFGGLISPYTRKVRILLSELGLEFETGEPDLANPSPEFVTVNPNRRVPVLSDDGTHLFESNLILDYLLQKYSKSGQGAPPLATEMIRQEHRWEDLKLLNVIETTLDSGLNLFQFSRENTGPEQSAYLQAELRRIQSNLDWLEERATPEGFIPGQFSVLDLNLVCTLQWAGFRKPFEWSGRPNLNAIVVFYQNRESIRATAPAS